MFIVPPCAVHSGAVHARRTGVAVSCARRVFANFNANIEDLPRSLQTYHLVLTYWPCHAVCLRSRATAGLIRFECTRAARMYPPPLSVNLFSGGAFTAGARNGASFWRVAAAFRDVRGIFTRSELLGFASRTGPPMISPESWAPSFIFHERKIIYEIREICKYLKLVGAFSSVYQANWIISF